MANASRSSHAATALGAALFVLMQAGCSNDGGFERVVEPTIDPPVAASMTAHTVVVSSAYNGATLLPAVIVKDQRGKGIEGVTVTFAVASGGGSVTGDAVITNSLGIAAVGGWILGAIPGINTLTASAPDLPSVTFTATATPRPCSYTVTSYEFGGTISGSLGGDDCLSDALFTDMFTTTLSSGIGAYVFRLSATFDAYLYFGTPAIHNGGWIGENNDESSTTTNSAIKALLPPGPYVIGVSSGSFYETGSYSLSSETTSTDISGCEKVFVARGVVTTQNIQTNDCVRMNGQAYADEFYIHLDAFQSLNVSMASTTVDSFLEIFQVDYRTAARTLVASKDNDTSATTDAGVTYTPATAAFYVIVATALNGQTGGYTLAVQ